MLKFCLKWLLSSWGFPVPWFGVTKLIWNPVCFTDMRSPVCYLRVESCAERSSEYESESAIWLCCIVFANICLPEKLRKEAAVFCLYALPIFLKSKEQAVCSAGISLHESNLHMFSDASSLRLLLWKHKKSWFWNVIVVTHLSKCHPYE